MIRNLPPLWKMALPLLLLAGCVAGGSAEIAWALPGPFLPTKIHTDTTWSGTVTISGETRVMPGAVLTIRPGTRILFAAVDEDGDGVLDSRLVVEGGLIARGTPHDPIIFTGAGDDPQPGDWLELRVDRAEGVVLEYCVLQYSRYGFHAHFSSGVLANSILLNNMDATRFGNCRFFVLHNRFEGNLGKGINFRDSRLFITGNEITGNRHGIFVFEKAKGTYIGNNLFSKNEVSDLRFGDFFNGSPPALDGNVRDDGHPLTILGRDQILPSAQKRTHPLSYFGPRVLKIDITPVWERNLGSFVDAAPVRASGGGRIAVATWGGDLFQLAAGTGEVLARTSVGDVVDGTPVPVGGGFLFPAWDHRIYSVDAKGAVTGSLGWKAGMADDHQQASPLVLGGDVVLGLWNGEFGTVDPGQMRWRWKISLDGAIRARPAFDGRELWVGTDGGGLYEIGRKGEVIRRVELGSPVRTTPAVFGEGDLAVVTRDGLLARVRGGRILWRRKLPGVGTYASPIFSGTGRLAVGDGSGAVSQFDGNGALIWRTALGSAVHALGGGEMLWAGTEDGRLIAINPVTGALTATLKAAGAVHSPPLITDGPTRRMVWAARDGVVRALDWKISEKPWGWRP